MNIVCHLPVGIQRLFHLEDKCGPVPPKSQKGTTINQQNAYAFYDNLVTNVDGPLSFNMADKNGTTTRITTSVRQIALLTGDVEASTTRLRTTLERARDLISETPLSENDRAVMLRGVAAPVTSQTRDPRMADPEGLLNPPWTVQAGQIADPYNPSDPRMVPAWYPKLSQATRYITLTPRVLDKTAVPTDRLRRLYEDLVLNVHSYLKARNVPSLFHPLCVGAQAHVFPSRHAYSNIQGSGGNEAIADWAASNGNNEYLLQNTVLGFKYPDGDQNQGPQIGGPYSWLWNESLARRFPLSVSTDTTITRGALGTGENRRTWNLYTADPLLELQRWINVANILLATGDTSVDARAAFVDSLACNAIYTGAQVQAYRMINRPYGSNVTGYREQVAREAAARKARQRGDLGVPGYQSSGDDAADIAMGVVGTVGLAISDFLKTGNPAVLVVSALARGMDLILTLLNSPEVPRNPYEYPIRMLPPSDGIAPLIPGITVKNALELAPCYRVR